MNNKQKMSSFNQRGFTLIELMIALVLGSLVVLAATILLLSGQRGMRLQQGAAEIQNNANFALNQITQDVRMANLGTSSATLNNSTKNGGVVFGLDNLTNSSGMNVNWVTKANTSESNVNVLNDQLTIQYKPVNVGEFDCEGNEITSAEIAAGDYVIQRYFIRSDDNPNVGETKATALSLACDAGRVNATGVTGLGGNGQIIMKRVDFFHVLLVTENTAGFQDMPIADYLQLANNPPRILGVKIGLLARSTNAVARDAAITKSNFKVYDKDITLKDTNSASNNLREVITQTIAMRNALGARQ